MIIGCYVPPLYYGFTCYPNLGIAYIVSFVTFGTIGIVIGFFPIFTTPRYIYIRIGFYLTVGWLSIVPVIHLFYLMGFAIVWNGAKWVLLMGLFYTFGAIFYSTRIPERWFPGSFNISLFGSHVIWHYFTMAAAGLHLWTCTHFFYLSRTTVCPVD
eukprot:TRINITY_DN2622_c0_g1_i3.p2 TRINITY_DN2622_c0_g1~~TRINITY_DN2622_c0_g1_i3.p2  ORF type:complete len:156 (+),score=10.85 TRINITY_DN2622_c0_g1_i3:583-1050(+)